MIVSRDLKQSSLSQSKLYQSQQLYLPLSKCECLNLKQKKGLRCDMTSSLCTGTDFLANIVKIVKGNDNSDQTNLKLIEPKALEMLEAFTSAETLLRRVNNEVRISVHCD